MILAAAFLPSGRGALAFALAAAFALVLAVLVLPRPGPSERTPPTCALEVRGDAVVLGPDAGPGELVLSAGTRMHLVLTPTSLLPEDLVARFFLVSGAGARALAVQPPPGPTVRVDGLRQELFPGAPAGRYELVALVADAGTAADEAALAAMALDPGRAAPGWRALRRPIALRGAPEERAVPVPRAVEEAAALRAQGKLDEAEQRLAGAPVGLPSTRLKARLALDRGRHAEAARLFREAIAAGRMAGDPESAGEDVLALSYVLLEGLHDAGAAERVLGDAADLLAAWPAGAADVSYTRAQAARARGDLRRALADLREATQQAERAGLALTRDAALEMRSDVLSTLGRHREALEIARAVALPSQPPCLALTARNNAAWIEIRAARGGAGGDARRAAAILGEALSIARSSCPMGAGTVLTNLAIASLEAGDLAGARRAAGDAEKVETPPDPIDAVWWAQVRAEAGLAEGHPEAARAQFERARALGERHHLQEARFEGALGRALTLDASNRVDEAHRSFEEAERALDAWSLAAPLGEGRGLFLTEHARAVRLHAAFLLRRGRPEDALRALRRGGSRYFALLDRPDAVAAEPPPLPRGVALLASATLPDGPAALAQLGARAVWARVPALGPDALGAWLAPFAVPLRGARRVLLPAGGAFRDVDLHAGLLDGRPLIARVPVAYTLDLPPSAAPPRPASPVALVVADPARDLPAVRATLASLRAALEAQGLRVNLLAGDAATRAAFREAVARPDVYFLHYAGHASFSGRDGLDAAFALADGPFTVRDILDLERVPPYAVLLGCSSAGTDPEADSLGLAQAFLVKGTLATVAARADLDAAVVERLGARLAADLDPAPDLPAALARAQAALAAEGSELRWSVLRAIVR